MVEKRPKRYLAHFHSTFWDYCNQGEFRLQKCDKCSNIEWPPSPVCSNCLSQNLTWTKLSGNGRIKSYCTFERQYYPECPAPWQIIFVELEEGPWFISNPKDIPTEDIGIGLPVKAAFIDCEDDHGLFKLPVFEKA
jgi:uncharacterized OB-fold protein